MKHEHDQENEIRLLSFRELRRLVGLSRSTVLKLEKAGNFPRRRFITRKRVAWRSDEVNTWIQNRATVEATESSVQP